MAFPTLKLGITINQGADFSLILLISNSSGPIDITDYLFSGEIKIDTNSSSPVVAEFVFDILDQTTNKGQVTWSLPNAVTAALITSISDAERLKRLTKPYVFDVKMEDTESFVSRIVEGIAFISPQVTQEAP